MALQMEGRTGPCDAGPLGSRSSSSKRDMSSIGTSTRRSKRFGSLASTMLTGLYSGTARAWSICGTTSSSVASTTVPLCRVTPDAPPKNRATSSSGLCVADNPMRWSGLPHKCSKRSSDSARWAPRFVETRAWISSTTTVSTERRASRAFEVSSKYIDSGVVIKMSAGCRENLERSVLLVSPVRIATTGSWIATPACLAEFAIPTSGARRFRSTSTANALIGLRYSTRHRFAGSGAASNINLFKHQRNAASVLPDPVGAHSSVDSPRAIGAQPRTCGRVGAGKTASNQSRTAGWNIFRLSFMGGWAGADSAWRRLRGT